MRTPVLIVLLLAAPVMADERLVLARRTMEAHVRMGDALRAKGDLDGALKAYRKAIAVYEKAMQPAPRGSREAVTKVQRPPFKPRKTAAEYIALLDGGKAGTAERYDATVQIGGLEDPAGIPVLVRVLQGDGNDLVRRAAAWSLGRFGKAAAPAVPALLAAVKSAEPYVAYMSARALSALAKDATGEPVSMGFSPTLAKADRAKVHAKWVAWWQANEAKFK